MARLKTHGGVAFICVLLVVFGAGCISDEQQENTPQSVPSEEEPDADLPNAEEAVSTPASSPVSSPASSPDTVLSSAEISDILFMEEEERLAHDVYVVFYEKWEMQVFKNIVDAEQSHTDSVTALVNRYGLDDGSSEVIAGEFSNSELQKLYDDLVSAGMQSPEDALRAAALVEETDIVDLQDAMSRTENADILIVYENLIAGSENHLRSFVKNLEQRGESYAPVVLSQDEYDAIISASGNQN